MPKNCSIPGEHSNPINTEPKFRTDTRERVPTLNQDLAEDKRESAHGLILSSDTPDLSNTRASIEIAPNIHAAIAKLQGLLDEATALAQYALPLQKQNAGSIPSAIGFTEADRYHEQVQLQVTEEEARILGAADELASSVCKNPMPNECDHEKNSQQMGPLIRHNRNGNTPEHDGFKVKSRPAPPFLTVGHQWRDFSDVEGREGGGGVPDNKTSLSLRSFSKPGGRSPHRRSGAVLLVDTPMCLEEHLVLRSMKSDPALQHHEDPNSMRQSIHSLGSRLNNDNLQSIAPEPFDEATQYPQPMPRIGHEQHFSFMFGVPSREHSVGNENILKKPPSTKVDLRGRSHVDISNNHNDFDVHKSKEHGPVARNWPNSRKRFVALVACLNTTCIGLLLGIYAGEVPAIQYILADLHHHMLLGNVVLYAGIALSTFALWPLPLLHGRKPYILCSLLIALALQVPQGLALSSYRDPSTGLYRNILLVSRGVSGMALGLTDMNINATMLDLFGSSLQSQNPHQEKVDPFDVRRHGGGCGL